MYWIIKDWWAPFSWSYTDLTDKPTIPDNTDYVDLTTAQTVAWNKTFSWILKKTESEYSITATSWTIDLNYNNWTYQKVTLTWTTTFTLSNPNRNFLTIKITNGWAQTVTRPTIKWAWWTAPWLTTSWTDVVSIYYDWTDYYWDYALDFKTTT